MQRALLTEIVALEGFAYICSNPTRGTDLFYGMMYPYQQDETTKGSEILVSTETTAGNVYTLQAFGEPIHSPEKLPDPLHFGRP